MGKSRITVKYKGRAVRVVIDNLKGLSLKTFFKLDFEPTDLIYCESNGASNLVPIGNPEDFTPDATYYLVAEDAEEEAASRSLPGEDAWSEPDLQEVLANAIICSQAAYATTDNECLDFFNREAEKHCLSNVAISWNEKCHFVIAEEKNPKSNTKRVYIAFKAVFTGEELKATLSADQLKGSSQKIKAHAATLEVASHFPYDMILSNNDLVDREIILCGHSFGGSVATIVAANIIITDYNRCQRIHCGSNSVQQQKIKCVTFGAPAIGDGDFEKLCKEFKITEKLFHVVHIEDPIHKLWAFTQNCDSTNQVNVQKCEKSLMEEAFELIALTGSAASAIPHAKVKMATDISEKCAKVLPKIMKTVSKNFASKINPIGNYLFYEGRDKNTLKRISCLDSAAIFDCIERYNENESAKDFNFFSSDYEHVVKAFCGGNFPNFQRTNTTETDLEDKSMALNSRYEPKITRGLVEVINSEVGSVLRLELRGSNILHFTCWKSIPRIFSPDKVLVETVQNYMGTNEEGVTFQQALHEPTELLSTIGDIVTFDLSTPFGSCSQRITDIRTKTKEIPNELCGATTTEVVIQRAIQRTCLVTAHIKGNTENMQKESNTNRMQCDLRQAIGKLSARILEKSDQNELMDAFEQQDQHMLSNRKEWDKIQNVCSKIENSLTGPLELKLKKSTGEKVLLGATIALGVVLGVIGIAIPPLGIAAGITATVEVLILVGFGGSFAALGATSGVLTYTIQAFRRSAVDKQYAIVLAYLTAQLYQKYSRKEDASLTRSSILKKVDDLQKEGSVYSREEALLLLYDKTLGLDNFKGSDVEKCTEKSLESVMTRIECVDIVHRIRKILAQECYVGVVGTQNAGKTTLLHHLWGVGGPTGQLAHTDKPCLYQLERRLSVVDFPGSNGLESYADTFATCGSMNNLLVMIVKYAGDADRTLANEVKLAFQISSGSKATKIILCINQCGRDLPAVIEGELSDKDEPVKYLKERFANKLNQFYKDQDESRIEENQADENQENQEDQGQDGEPDIEVCKDDIFFTDWLLDDETRIRYGISGVDDIKKEIKAYLLKQKIFDSNEEQLMDKCLSHDFPHKAAY